MGALLYRSPGSSLPAIWSARKSIDAKPHANTAVTFAHRKGDYRQQFSVHVYLPTLSRASPFSLLCYLHRHTRGDAEAVGSFCRLPKKTEASKGGFEDVCNKTAVSIFSWRAWRCCGHMQWPQLESNKKIVGIVSLPLLPDLFLITFFWHWDSEQKSKFFLYHLILI